MTWFDVVSGRHDLWVAHVLVRVVLIPCLGYHAHMCVLAGAWWLGRDDLNWVVAHVLARVHTTG